MFRALRLAAAIVSLMMLAACSSDEGTTSQAELPPASASSFTDTEVSAEPSDGVACPDDTDEVIRADVDGDGVDDLVYLRRDDGSSANLLGMCGDTVAAVELDVGGLATSLAGAFDVDRDGIQEVFVFDTSARSIIYSAATLTPSGFEMTTLLLERAIDTETGAPFNAANFRCLDGADGSELFSVGFEAADDLVRVTVAMIGLEGRSMTETIVEFSEADPSAALIEWGEPDHCFERFASFDHAAGELSAELGALGFEDLGGDHQGPDSASFVVGRGGVDARSRRSATDRSEPDRTGPRSDLPALTETPC